MKKLVLTLIKLYQKYLSLDQGYLRHFLHIPDDARICRFTPTCSQYTFDAIDRYGLIKGGFLGTWRIIRCNPFTKGGVDPVK